MNLRLIFRNETSRDDAVYIITAITQNGVVTVAGEWGKWDTFRKAGKLQRKVYYSGTSETRARGLVRQMQLKRYQRDYIYQPALSRTDDQPQTPAPSTPPPAPVEPPQPAEPPVSHPGIQTRAGALEF